MEAHLSNRHRDTVERIFSRPPSHNIEWREVVSLLEAVGTVTHQHSGKLRFRSVLRPRRSPRPAERTSTFRSWWICGECWGQDLGAPDRSAATADRRVRAHGDGQWGSEDAGSSAVGSRLTCCRSHTGSSLSACRQGAPADPQMVHPRDWRPVQAHTGPLHRPPRRARSELACDDGGGDHEHHGDHRRALCREAECRSRHWVSGMIEAHAVGWRRG